MAKLDGAKEQMEHREMRVATSAHYVTHEAKVAPKLGMDLTAQEWDLWRLGWAQYKHYNRPLEDHNCRYLLQCDCDYLYDFWDCFSPELKTEAYGLGNNDTISEKQFLKEVKELVVTCTSHFGNHISQQHQLVTSASRDRP